jgi:hypothetical protein
MDGHGEVEGEHHWSSLTIASKAAADDYSKLTLNTSVGHDRSSLAKPCSHLESIELIVCVERAVEVAFCRVPPSPHRLVHEVWLQQLHAERRWAKWSAAVGVLEHHGRCGDPNACGNKAAGQQCGQQCACPSTMRMCNAASWSKLTGCAICTGQSTGNPKLPWPTCT